jgi:thiol-disulfide isomerase/thioredoxin
MIDALAVSKNTEKAILIIFTGDWCSSCRYLKKDLADNMTILEDLIVCYIDCDKNPDIVKEYNIKRIPQYFILQNSRERNRTIGYYGLQSFKKWLNHNE